MHSTHSTEKSAVVEKIQIGLTKLLELFMKKRKTNENVFTIEKEVKEKEMDYMEMEMERFTLLTVGLIKNIFLHKNVIFQNLKLIKTK